MTSRKNIYHRIEWIDFCKACAIFAMVFAHCGGRMVNSDIQADRWIHLWHMPLFFIVSGMVLNGEKWPVCLLVSCALIYIIKNSESLIKRLPGYKWIGETGRSTLVIYLLHGEILRVLPFGNIAMNSTLATTACQLMITAGVVALCLLAARLINRFLSWSLGKF